MLPRELAASSTTGVAPERHPDSHPRSWRPRAPPWPASRAATGVRGSAWSVEGAADGCWVPLAAALGGGDAVVVEGIGDRGQAVAGRSLAPDPLDYVGGDGGGPAEPDALKFGSVSCLAATSAFASLCSSTRSASSTPGRVRAFDQGPACSSRSSGSQPWRLQAARDRVALRLEAAGVVAAGVPPADSAAILHRCTSPSSAAARADTPRQGFETPYNKHSIL